MRPRLKPLDPAVGLIYDGAMRNLWLSIVFGLSLAAFGQNRANLRVKVYPDEGADWTAPFPDLSRRVCGADLAALRGAFPRQDESSPISLADLRAGLFALGEAKLGRAYANPAERADTINGLLDGLFITVDGYVMELPNAAKLAGDAVYNFSVRLAETPDAEQIHREGNSAWPIQDPTRQYFFARIVRTDEKPHKPGTFRVGDHLRLSCPAAYVIGVKGISFFSLNCNAYAKLKP